MIKSIDVFFSFSKNLHDIIIDLGRACIKRNLIECHFQKFTLKNYRILITIASLFLI